VPSVRLVHIVVLVAGTHCSHGSMGLNAFGVSKPPIPQPAVHAPEWQT
jgi:hypothetical protein